VRVRALAESLRTGQITLEEWELAMRALSKEVHLYSAAAARGGWAQLSPDDTGRVGRIVRDEYRWIRNFRTEIEDGLPLDGRFAVRTELYAQAGRETFHKVERQVQLEQGQHARALHPGRRGSLRRAWVLHRAARPRLGADRDADRDRAAPLRPAVQVHDRVHEHREARRRRADRRAAAEGNAGPYRAKYAMAVMDMDTCDHCAQFDGVIVKLDDARRLPDHACTSERGCQCQWVFIRKEESA
jgi:hypothetical protein